MLFTLLKSTSDCCRQLNTFWWRKWTMWWQTGHFIQARV